MRNKFFKRLLVVVSIVLSFSISNNYNVIAAYPEAPTDLKVFESQISKSLVTIRWSSHIGLGFAGSYNISSDQKNQGINSILVTNLSNLSEDSVLLRSCFAINGTKDVLINFETKEYAGKCLAYNNDGSDLANIQTSLNLPTIPLYDSYIPSIGEWVLVAYYVEGFGINFASSRIKLINNSTYILAIDKFEPTPKSGGLLFNSLGNFIGVLTNSGNGTVPVEYYKVHGAPLQCQKKSQTKGTITMCPTSQENIWVTPNPSQISQTDTTFPGNEAVDGFKAVEDAYAAYQESLSQCLDSYKSASMSVNKYLRILKFDLICKSDESQAKDVLSKAKTISTSKQFSNKEIDQLNSYTDSMNLYAEAADTANAQIQDAITYLNYAIDSKEEVRLVNLFATNTWRQLNSRIAKLSKAMKSKIVTSPEYIEITESLTQWSEFSKLVNDFLNSISPTTNLGYLENANSELKSMEPQVTSSSLEYDAAAISGLLPKYVCIKGKDVVSIIGKNCKTGYKKITV